ncbi:MAG TPA: class I SAM-dependent methyltransferase, partial [Anaerolineaceae bacterium]|nr:class I SAM-dependent methyltransferase [Anaerolineaceae bacterium]
MIDHRPLFLNEGDFTCLLQQLGPSLGLWRAAEIAVLREQQYEPPVLDLGCGDGFITAMVLTHVAVGVDPNAPALARARLRGLYEQVEPVPVEASGLS